MTAAVRKRALPVRKKLINVFHFPVEEEPMTNPCGDCRSMIHITDQKVSRMIAGTEDFCGAGCKMVKEIRVPFPDCSIHGNPFASKKIVGGKLLDVL